MLTRLSPGVVDNSDLHFARPMDNAGLGGFIANGAKGGNDFTIDGAPNVVSWQQVNYGGARVGFSPPADSIAEFRVTTNDFDAQQGHTAGANVNLALRSGGNDFHGAASYFNRSSSRSSTSPLQDLSGQPASPRTYDRCSAMLSGPIFKDKTFFMVSYEHLKDVQTEPATYTVPTDKMRNGDFSELLASNIKIYDPLTGTTNRTAFPGNIIPANRLNPIALKLLSYYPHAEPGGKGGRVEQLLLRPEPPVHYNSALLRLDHNFTVGPEAGFLGLLEQETRGSLQLGGGTERLRGLAGLRLPQQPRGHGDLHQHSHAEPHRRLPRQLLEVGFVADPRATVRSRDPRLQRRDRRRSSRATPTCPGSTSPAAE